MRYDDRLVTVLRLPSGGGPLAHIQWRQLIDLLGTAPADARGESLDLAHLRLAEVSAQISPVARAAILAEPGIRLRSPRLLATLAGSEPQVAYAAMAAADLSEEQWLDLVPALPPRARPLLAMQRDLPASVRALLARLGATGGVLPGNKTPAVAANDSGNGELEVPAQATETAAPAEIDTIGAIVRRIEAFRRAREDITPAITANSGDSPLLPLGEDAMGDAQTSHASAPIAAFDFTSNAEGRIIWSEPTIAPMVVGTSLPRFATEGATQLTDAIGKHQPIRGARLTLVGAETIAGAWQVDAGACFDAAGGRFTGHAGRFRRAALRDEAVIAGDAHSEPDRESDRLRQILHELRTPVNAIQGFAEIIQQQLFGPTPHQYRALAAAIAGDAAQMLAGFEELERFARLDTGAMALDAGESDLRTALENAIALLAPQGASPRASFTLTGAGATPIALAAEETERLCWRLLASLVARSMPSEALALELGSGAQAHLHLQLPVALASLDDEALFRTGAGLDVQGESSVPRAGMFGPGFSLRLAAVEAQAAGGELRREGGWLMLTLPGLTHPPIPHSDDAHEGDQVGLPAA